MRHHLGRLGGVSFLAAIGLACTTACESPALAPVPADAAPTEDAGEPDPPEAGDADTTPLPERIQPIVDGLHALLECPDQIWRGDSWTDRQILFVGTEKKEAFLWNDRARKGTTHAVPFSELPEALKSDFYFDFVDYRGAKTLAVSLDITEWLTHPTPTLTPR